MRQLRLAFRTLFRTPFVTVVTILSLGLGIGANTAIFSVFNELLLRPLPVPAPDELVNLGAPGPKPGSNSCGAAGECSAVFSYPMFRDLERAGTVFTGVAAHVLFGASVGVDGETIAGDSVLVSASYFPVLKLTPFLGRFFDAQADPVVGEPREAVVSYAYWQSRFASDPNVVGRQILVSGQSLTVVGVAPRGFSGTTMMPGRSPDLFLPMTLRRVLQPTFNNFENRRAYWAYLFARLAPGVSIDDARATMNVKYQAIINQVEVPLQTNQSEQTMARFKAKPLVVEPGRSGQARLHNEARLPLFVLLGLTGIVLLIACANVANLLLARAAGRTTEIAIRLAIGAGRRHLVGQLLLESCVLALISGAVGVFLSQWTLALIVRLMPNEGTPMPAFVLSSTVLWFAFGLSMVTGVVFGLFPALHSTRPNLIAALRNQAGQPSGGRSASWFRNSLVVSQIALSMTLLIVAGLLARSLFNVTRVDLGLSSERMLTLTIAPGKSGYAPERSLAIFAQAEDAFGAIPGTTGVTASSVQLLAGNDWGSGMSVQGFKAGMDMDVSASINRIGTTFFRTMGGRILAGREFTTGDNLNAPRVAIVNEAFVRKFKMGQDVVGKRISLDQNAQPNIEVVGLVADMKYSRVKDAIPPQVYLPYRQDDQMGQLAFYIRTSGEAQAAMNTVRRVVNGIDPNLPVVGLKTMDEQVRSNVSADRVFSTLSATFALLATLLATVGVYGVLAYTVSQRTREFGLRMALGAAPGVVQRMVLRQVAWMTGIGAIVGVVLAIGIGRLMATLLFNVGGQDPTVIALSLSALSIVAIGAGLVPAMRAARTDPMTALRYQ